MTKKQGPPPDDTDLRRGAEERVGRRRPAGQEQTAEGDTSRLVHELQVHQIELEMQNEALLESRAQVETLLAQYTDLYDFAPVGYLTLDREGTIRQVNLAGARLLGVERSGLVNRRFGFFVAEGDRHGLSGLLQRVFAGEATECHEVTLPQEGSPPLVVRIEGTRSADGRECRVVLLDITARARAEEAARANTVLLQIAGRAARFGGWSVNLAENRVLWSDEVAAIHDEPAGRTRSVEEGIGFYAPEWREKIREVFGACAREGTPFDEELEIITARGRRVWVRAMGEAIRDGFGAITTVQGAFQDTTERKQAEEALHASLYRQKALLEAIPDIIMEVDGRRRYTWANHAGLEFFGEDVIGREAAFYFEGEQDTYASVAPLFDGSERVFYVESWQARRDGQKRLLAWWCRTLKDAHGNVIGALSTARDITDRRRTEDELRSARAFLDSVINAIADPVFVKDDIRRFVLVNNALCAIVGRPREALLGEDGDDMFPEDQVAVFRRVDAAVLATGEENLNEEFLSNLTNGEVRTIVTRKSRYMDPAGSRFLVGVIRDVTERRRAEEALRESEALYRSLFENLLNGFAYCRMLFEGGIPQDFIYLAVNDAFRLQTGLKDVVGRKVSEIIPGIREADPQLFEIYGRVAMTGRPERLEMFVQALQMWFAVSVYSPAPEHFVAVFDVITERKRAEEKAAEQLDELRRWHDAMVGRERRVLEVKEEVNALLARLGEPPRYLSVAEGQDKT